MNDKLKVAVEGTVYQWQLYGGISRVYNEILPRICSLDKNLIIIMFTEGPLSQALPKHPRILHKKIPNINRLFRPSRIWMPLIPNIRRLFWKIQLGHGHRVVWHSTYYTSPNRWKGWRVVTVLDMIHELFPHLFNGPYDDFFREKKKVCIKKADAVICISETTRRDLQNFYDIDPNIISVVPLACSNAFYLLKRDNKNIAPPMNKPFLLYVGDRNHYKNFDMLVRAYSLWSKKKDIGLFVVGKPWSGLEKERLAELKLQNYVKIRTNIDDEKLRELYNQATAFVYPSLYEGFGIPLLEAMACGCPIIASSIPSTVEVAKDCPIYFDPNSIDSLLDSFEHVLCMERNSSRIKNGLQLVSSYSWNKTAQETLKVYHALYKN